MASPREVLSLAVAWLPLLVACERSPAAPAPPGEYEGVCTGAAQSSYVLPYPVGVTRQVYQGYPAFNHEPQFRYAVDFRTPPRSTIVAARSGTVLFIEQSFADNDYDFGHENYVILDHEDGTYSRYVHLVKNGALVERWQRVSQGDPIGLSGATGSGIQHLHFDITTACSTRECQTVPACFKNTRSHPNGLARGESYLAEGY